MLSPAPPFVGERAVRSHSFDLPLEPTAAFRFFEPEGERSWAPGWDPIYVYPADGLLERGMVFTTGEGDEYTIWIVLGHAPAAGAVEYARITPGVRLAIVRVQCVPLEGAVTRVTVSYEYTGLSDAGNAYVRAMDEPAFRAFIDSWGETIRRVLKQPQ
jgi:hypothetical protein